MSIDVKTLGKVAVLMGGSSAERQISIMSGTGVLAALRSQGVDAHAFDPSERDVATSRFLRQSVYSFEPGAALARQYASSSTALATGLLRSNCAQADSSVAVTPSIDASRR